jgi:CHAT domain-containing protein/Tfp pilus assembly protein PilF
MSHDLATQRSARICFFHIRYVSWLLWLGVAAAGITQAQQPVPDKQLSPQQKERLEEGEKFARRSGQLRDSGKLAEAIETGKKALAVYREVRGNEDSDVASGLEFLGDMLAKQGDFAAGRKALDEGLATRIKLFGKAHWKVTDARLTLDHLALLEKLTPEQRQKLADAEGLNAKAETLSRQGKYREAVAPSLDALETERHILGEKHRDFAVDLFNLGQLYEEMDDYAKAESLYLQVIQVEKETLGYNHPRYATGLSALARLYQSRGASAKAEPLLQQALTIQKESLGEKDTDYSESLYNLATLYESQGNYAKAEPLYLQSLQIRKEVLGEKDPLYAQNLDGLADLYQENGEFAKAEPLFQQSAEIYRVVYGEKHPYYASCLDNLGRFYSQAGQYSKAESLLKQALQIRKDALGEKNATYAVSLKDLAYLYNQIGEPTKAEPLYQQAAQIERETLGEKHPYYATSLGNLAHTYESMGDYVKAEPIMRKVLQLTKDSFGEKHPKYAHDLSSLGMLYESMGDHAKAEPLLQQSLEIRKIALGEKHPDYAKSLSNLASLYEQSDDYAKAEPLWKQVLQIEKESLGEKHPQYALSLQNLGYFYEMTSDYAKAENCFVRAGEILKTAVGEKHPIYVANLEHQGFLYCAMGEYAKAEPFYRQALKTTEVALGENDPRYAGMLNNLAALYQSTGRFAEAEPLCREALLRAERQLEIISGVQSERQQLAMRLIVWGYLDRYLYLTAEAELPTEPVYAEVLKWKGEVAARQQQIRRTRGLLAAGGKEVTRLQAELTEATRSLAALSQPTAGANPKRQSQLAALGDKIEDLQTKLAGASAEFRQQLGQQRGGSGDIRKALPADAALIDLLSYSVFRPAKVKGAKETLELHLTAFVVRRDQPIERVELGLAAPIERAVEAWRKQFGRAGNGEDPGADLRRLVWRPLEKYVIGSNTVLISPESVTAPIAWAALPGTKPGTYLIDDYSLAIVPIPRFLPDLLAENEHVQSDQGKPAETPSLLLVGDVDFGADPGKSDLLAMDRGAARGDQPLRWSPLPGTRDEVAAIKESFLKRFGQTEPIELTKDRATKSAVRNQIGNCQYLHFSTHGFFAPPQLRSAMEGNVQPNSAAGASPLSAPRISGFQPGLLSGLVLAGANRPLEDGKEDGILTALEVEEMDLSKVQLATLSACETGLGETAGAEGLLGLQRAFQTAGAKSVVAGLWKVPDKATQMLMARFYDNLWQKKMSKLEALCEAQRWMLHEAPKEPGLARGLQFATESLDKPDKSSTLPPYYWAAFVLSGDWR